MRKTAVFVIFLLLGCLTCLLPGSQDQSLAEVNRLVGTGQLSEALSLLSKAIRSHASDPLQQAAYIKALADFHKDVCGDMRKALMNYRRVISSPIPGDHELKQAALAESAGIRELETKHRQLNSRLKSLLARANRKRDPAAVKEDIFQLKELIKNNPGYYLLHEAYYALGINYQALKKPGKAYPLLRQAMEIKPGIIFYLPAKARARQARNSHLRNNINNVTGALLYLLLAVTMILFYKSRPWQWLRLKHIMPLVVLTLCWWVVFNISHSLLGKSFSGSEGRVVKIEEGRDTEYLSASPGSPGSGVVKPLFRFGLVGVIVLFLFSLSMRQFKSKKATVISGLIFGFLLFSAISTLYYMKYCDRASTFKSSGKGVFYYTGGRIHFNPEDPEANILTNPLAYPGIEVDKITDPYLQEWVKKHCPRIKTASEE